jgi:tryptophan-rich sensory protein
MKDYLKYILIPIFIAIFANLLIYLFNINKKQKPSNSYIPPGIIVAIIWIIQFGLLGYLYYLVTQKQQKLSQIFIIILFIFCLSYPFITQFKQNISRILNIIAFILAFATTIIINEQLPIAIIYIIPLLLWTMYVALTDSL